MSIVVRHSEPADIERIRQIYLQPSNYAATLQLPYPSQELWQNRLGKLHESFYCLVATEDGEILGQIGIDVCTSPRRRHVANLGLAVSERARRRGVATALMSAAVELCEGWLGVTRIELGTYTDNHAGISLFKKHGFVVEGTGVGYALRAGVFVDVHFMARCRAASAS